MRNIKKINSNDNENNYGGALIISYPPIAPRGLVLSNSDVNRFLDYSKKVFQNWNY